MYTGSWHPVLRGCGREFFGTQFPHRKIKLRNELRITAKCLGSGWLATVTVKYSIVSCYPLVVWRSKVNNYEKHIFFFFWSFGSMLGYSGSLLQDKILDPRGCITNWVSDPDFTVLFCLPDPRLPCTRTQTKLHFH